MSATKKKAKKPKAYIAIDTSTYEWFFVGALKDVKDAVGEYIEGQCFSADDSLENSFEVYELGERQRLKIDIKVTVDI